MAKQVGKQVGVSVPGDTLNIREVMLSWALQGLTTVIHQDPDGVWLTAHLPVRS